jgi:hypothetical protein
MFIASARISVRGIESNDMNERPGICSGGISDSGTSTGGGLLGSVVVAWIHAVIMDG